MLTHFQAGSMIQFALYDQLTLQRLTLTGEDLDERAKELKQVGAKELKHKRIQDISTGVGLRSSSI
ncbi:MAG: hypothetical protein AAGD23_09785, partial [Pseudomonadota bacterium]